MKGRLLSCPSEAPFAATLADALYGGALPELVGADGHAIGRTVVFVPSKAALSALNAAFVRKAEAAGHRARPSVFILGDRCARELFGRHSTREARAAAMDKLNAIPPAIGEFDRKLALFDLVQEAAQSIHAAGGPIVNNSPAATYAATGRIIALIKECHDEGADLARLLRLDAGFASGSGQISLRLLREAIKGWIAHLAALGKIDPEDARNRDMALTAELIAGGDFPVVIAGSTGSIAPTVELMRAALSAPCGAVVLPALDLGLDAESFAILEDHPEHPQHGLSRLLGRLNASRADVEELKVSSAPDLRARARFVSEALRPYATTARWRAYLDGCASGKEAPPQGLFLIEAASPQEEAEVAALILGEVAMDPARTAALISPDARLHERVRIQLLGWGIEFKSEDADDRLNLAFAARAAFCCARDDLRDALALLRHAPPAPEGEDKGARRPWRQIADLFDLGAARQMWRPARLSGLPEALARTAFAISAREARHPALQRVDPEAWQTARQAAHEFVAALSPLLSAAQDVLPLGDWLSRHGEVLCGLSDLGIGYVLEDTDALLQALAARAPRAAVSLDAYAAFFHEVAMEETSADPACLHPRLILAHPFDARLAGADVLVLSGLNEGSWPASLTPDPWLSRGDRGFLGLGAPERRIGQSAHDFFTFAAGCAANVYLTRSRMQDGAAQRPSRWLARMIALASGLPGANALCPPQDWLGAARALRRPPAVTPAPRPAPRPPVSLRPRKLSVTALEIFLANPYAIYARYILRLEPLKALGEGMDAREKGILYHAALQRYFERYPSAPPSDAARVLLSLLDEAAREAGFDLDLAPFWRPRFARFATWFAGQEAKLRRGAQMVKSEVGGKLVLPAPAGPFEITARADRIDVLHGYGVRIYDFKVSKAAAAQAVRRGAPQLALEGLLASQGAFFGLKPASTVDLAYIVMTGGEPPGEFIVPREAPLALIGEAHEGIEALIARFDDSATPYEYKARPMFKDKTEYDPYAHLARVEEWETAASFDRASEGGDG